MTRKALLHGASHPPRKSAVNVSSRFAPCALLFPSLRKSAVNSPLQNFDQSIVRNREVFVCRRLPTNKKAILCALYTKLSEGKCLTHIGREGEGYALRYSARCMAYSI